MPMLAEKGVAKPNETVFSIKRGRTRTIAKKLKIGSMKIQELEPQGSLGPYGKEDCTREKWRERKCKGVES